MRLLEERLAPLTYRIGLLKLPLQQASDALFEWGKELERTTGLRDVRRKRLSEPLEKSLLRLDPLSVNGELELLVSAGDDWTAYFNNYISGSSPDSAIRVLTRQTGAQGMILSDRPDTYQRKTGKGMPGSTLFAIVDRGRHSRWLQALRDGDRWAWEDNGERLAIEEPDRYTRPRIKERFNSETLLAYCSALGIHLADAAFYGPAGELVTHRPSATALIDTRNLADVRARLGLPDVGVAPHRVTLTDAD
jgi:hypothetical protein